MATAMPIQAAQAPRSLKRSRDDISEPKTPDNSQKRQKVSFSPNVEVRSMETTNDKPLALIQEEVRVALDRHRYNDNGKYDQLKTIFQAHPDDDDAPSYSSFRKYLSAVTAQAYHMGTECGGLLFALLESRWLERDDQIWIDFQRFLAALLTAHSVYLPTIMNWIVDQFSGASSVPLSGTDQDLIYDRLHRTIVCLLQYVTTAQPFLESAIRLRFPFHRAKTKRYVEFVKNILRVSRYLPDMEDNILRLIIEKITAIDVQIGVSVDDLDEDEMELLEKQLMDDMAVLLHGESDDEPEEDLGAGEEDEQQKSLKELKIMKDSMLKLDAVISLMFEHYHRSLAKSVLDKGSKASQTSPFNMLVSTFTSSILTTYNSRHSQFILFRFSQLNPDFYTSFTKALLKCAFDKSQSLMLRMSAVSYIASFAARGAKVSKDNVRALFNRLCLELEKMRSKLEATAKGPDPDRYRLYYTVFQGCMYIFCFRWRDFVLDSDDVDSEDRKWYPGIKDTFSVNIHSKLNPLKVCAPLIVDMFAKVTKALSFLYIYSILETNKRVRLSRTTQFGTVARETALTLKSSEASLRLDAHYAFEPYLLPTSKRWVNGLYVTFSTVAPPGMLDDDDSSEEDDE